MEFIPYIVYGIVVAIFLVISSLALFHVHRFRVEWDQTRFITVIFVIYSAVVLGYSVMLLMNTSWSELI